MWGGRFSENPDKFMLEFGASIDVDIELLDADIAGSIAWVEALGRAGMLDDSRVTAISSGLEKIRETMRDELDEGNFVFDRSLEDVHMTVESRLIDLIGEDGARLHTGRSRNDQVALDERMYLKRALDSIRESLSVLQGVILSRAEEHIDTIVPSFTHLQQAQPVRLAHYLMSWFWMLDRDRGRFLDAYERADVLPLGSGAVAGSGFSIDREYLREKLGFGRISENSMDATSDRDYIIETLSAASMLMMHLSRMCEDLIIWSSSEFGYVSLSDRYSTGSSMMPQKKNPDSLELVRGKTGRVYGSLVGMLTVMKGLPFSYGKDMQEDKEPLFDTVGTVLGCLRIMSGALGECVFRSDRMREAFDDGVYATDIADYLTERGMPFRHAHEVAGELVKWAAVHNTILSEIPMPVFREYSELFGDDFAAIFSLEASADRRSVMGGTGRDSVLQQIIHAKSICPEQYWAL